MTSKDDLIEVIEEWDENISKENSLPRNLDPLLKASIGLEEVTVLRGARRAGKTFMLYSMKKGSGGLYINFEDERLSDFEIEDFEKIMNIAQARKDNILYLDEVQEVPMWEKFAHRAHRKVKIFVTGSNSKLLSSDYSKALTGRTKTFTAMPLSFSEFLKFKGIGNSREAIEEYLRIGGFPRIVLSGNVDLAKEYLDRTIYRDIVGRYDIRNPEALKDIAHYLLSNIGKEFSYHSLKQVSGIRHGTTVRDYVGYLQKTYLIDLVKYYSASLKTQEVYSKKVYAIDPAYMNLGTRMDDDSGLRLENIIFLHLKRISDVYYGKIVGDVDFIKCSGTKPQEAINVTYEASMERTSNREFKGLQKASKELKIPAHLISVYSIKKVPKGITSHLAHRYLLE